MPLNPVIPLLVYSAGLFKDIPDLGFVGVDLDLDLVKDGAEILMILGMNDLADIGKLKPFSTACFEILIQAISLWPICITPWA